MQTNKKMYQFDHRMVAKPRVWARSRRQKSKRRIQPERLLVKCGCCNESLEIVIFERNEISGNGILEINGISASISEWRALLLPLLGVPDAAKAQ